MSVGPKLTQDQSDQIQKYAAKELFKATRSGRVVDWDKVKALSNEQRALVMHVLGVAPKNLPKIKGNVSQLIENLPRGEVGKHQKSIATSVGKKFQAVFTSSKVSAKGFEQAVASKKNELLPQDSAGVYEKLGVTSRKVGVIVSKVLSGQNLTEADFAKLQKHTFVVVMAEGNRTQAIANKAFLLGEGTYKSVYQAYNVQTGEDVALALERVRDDGESMGDFAKEVGKEVAFAADFRGHESHFILPHKITVAGSNVPGTLMPLAKGESLRDIMRAATPEQKAAFSKQIMQAASLMHDKGWIHRDLKPANLLVGEDGKLKVSDFGLAKKADSVNAAGSPGYLAPEFVASEDAKGTNKVDSFSVGIIIYNMLFPSTELERAPRGGGSEEYVKQVEQIISGLGKQIKALEKTKKPTAEQKAELQLYKALQGLLQVDPDTRMSVKDALKLFPDDALLVRIFKKAQANENTSSALQNAGLGF